MVLKTSIFEAAGTLPSRRPEQSENRISIASLNHPSENASLQEQLEPRPWLVPGPHQVRRNSIAAFNALRASSAEPDRRAAGGLSRVGGQG